jgi:fumarate reductase subunit D
MHKYHRSNEPIWWLPFILGGGIAAVFLPGLILAGLIVPHGLQSYDLMTRLAGHPLGRLFFLVVISLSLFHWAHRFRYTLVDLGIHGARQVIAALCYGSAIIGSLLAVYLAFTLPSR